ncbi:MAG: hypothetical protein A2031_07925 [Deltaproteobacteria bacterium RBG_19FT_COMBO_43_11]|nr:MAG: hypothetical protein A2W27_08150 [Deltaproteobacteria bacterium RBG_16_44_11]OGP87123.1 MAG: hypothetical protein A2031_07925 [Deltaproteobacteria bacterium RBG_19FT_COMBO_43_11]
MIRLLVALASDGTVYVPAPCRGVVSGLKAVYQTNTVEPGDTIIASRDTTAVNTLTAVTTAGLVVETGVPDVTNKGLVFDPADTTPANQVIKLVANGAAGAALVEIEFDEFAYVKQAASEA